MRRYQAEAAPARARRHAAQIPPRARPGGSGRALRVGPPGDRYEREADRVARQAIGSSAEPARVGRVHGDAGVAADPGVAQAIERARVGGRPVPDHIRRRMENLTGAPLGGVRLHVDQGADRLNDTLRSRAFTVGADVFVRRSLPGR